MSPSPPLFVSVGPAPDAAPAVELAAGLLAQPARIAPKFLYDRLGSALFSAICELPEYYPTRTEAAIFDAHGPALAAAVRGALPGAYTLVDLGAGDGGKAASLFGMLQPARYLAVDISGPHLRQALAALQTRHPHIAMAGAALDFSQRLRLPAGLLDGPALVFYPGSSIGNFDPGPARRLLREARELTAAGGALLIGVDLVKPADVLQAAYDDALGLTAAFNLNLLRHVNRLLGSDFDVRDWRHVARVDAGSDAGCLRVEMHLEARRGVDLAWPGGGRRFAAGERIHTENSYKWQRADFEALLREAGFARVRHWTDERGWFALLLAEER